MKLRIKVYGDIQVFRQRHGDGWCAEVDVEDDDLVEIEVVEGKNDVVARAYIKVDSRTGLDIVHK